MSFLQNILLIVTSWFFMCGCDSENIVNTNTGKVVKEKMLDGSNIDENYDGLAPVFLDFNGDGLADTLQFLDKVVEAPGTFRKIQIKGKNLNSFELKADDAWDTIPINLRTKNDKDVHSDYVFIKRNKNSIYVLLTGYPFPTGREDFALIEISNNNCTLLTKEQVNEISALEDLDGDGNMEIVLNPISSRVISHIESQNANIMSYSPCFIYRLSPNFKLDTTLTRKYNEKNYVWAGLENAEHKKVLWVMKDNEFKLISE